MRIDDPSPGDETQVDFGLMGYVRSADGKRRKLHVLIVTLPMSRYQFVWPTFLQTTEALVEGLDAAWKFFDGITRYAVLDNTSAAIVRASAQDPGINPSFAEYAQVRGFFVDPARVRDPWDKARVENQVPFARERWFAGESFSDALSALRAAAETWSRDVAGCRMHGTTRRVPREVFEAEERYPFGQPRPDAQNRGGAHARAMGSSVSESQESAAERVVGEPPLSFFLLEGLPEVSGCELDGAGLGPVGGQVEQVAPGSIPCSSQLAMSETKVVLAVAPSSEPTKIQFSCARPLSFSLVSLGDVVGYRQATVVEEALGNPGEPEDVAV